MQRYAAHRAGTIRNFTVWASRHAAAGRSAERRSGIGPKRDGRRVLAQRAVKPRLAEVAAPVDYPVTIAGPGTAGRGFVDYAETLRIVGRVLLGGLFVFGGVHHFFLLPALTSALAARGVPAPRLALITSSVFQAVAGLALVLGLCVLAASIGLVLFTVVASFLLLNYWDMEGPERDAAKLGWQTNLAIIGGLLIAASQGL